MREILFRGKRVDNGEWVYGDIYQPNTNDALRHRYREIWIHSHETGDMIQVIPETVGQYIGLDDKNGKKIFKGDIVKCTNYRGEVEGTVDYHGSLYYIACSSGYSDEYLVNCSNIEAIGTIHDKEE